MKKLDVSLKDYFAGQILSGLMASDHVHEFFNSCKDNKKEMTKAVKATCFSAYGIAEMMIKIKEEKGDEE